MCHTHFSCTACLETKSSCSQSVCDDVLTRYMWQGDALVEVEHRGGSKGRFGEGRRKQMRFGKFLERLAAGDDTLYLTTQEAGAPASIPSLSATSSILGLSIHLLVVVAGR